MTHEEAIREWIARKIRGRGHKITREQIRNVSYGINPGFEGTDVTPPDDPEPSIRCEIRISDKKVGYWTDNEGWMEHHETLHITPVELVQECLAILEEPA